MTWLPTALLVAGLILTGCKSSARDDASAGRSAEAAEGGQLAVLHDAASVFGDLPVAVHAGVIDDFGHRRRSAAEYLESAPPPGEVREVVKRAVRAGIPVRVRGAGHSTHGGSLPNAGELLLRTQNLRSYAFTEPGTVTADAGISIHGLYLFLHEKGYLVPVFNGGGFGPSVGGYLLAGGFGPTSAQYGGFWENVESVEMVDGRGRELVIGRDDPDFPWLFGSMGQLGVIVSVKLRVVPLSDDQAYPLGQAGTVPGFDEEKTSVEPETPLWLTMFGPAEDLAQMTAAVADLRSRFDILDYVTPDGSRYNDLGQYSFPIRFGEFNPPLINAHQGDLVAHGLWGYVKPGVTEEQFESFLLAYHQIATSHASWTRYLASEPLEPDFDFRAYWGDDVYERFLQLKRKYDPRDLINRGSVFPVADVVEHD